jgi:hypothetical protein
MGRIYENEFDGIPFTFRYNLIPIEIDIDASIERVYMQTLFKAIRDAECSEIGRVFPHLCNSDGRVTLQIDVDGEVKTDLTITLLNGTLLNALKDNGKFYIKGGNIVPDYVNGYTELIKENPALTYIVNLSQTGVITKVSSGSGLSQNQNDRLMAIPTETRVINLLYDKKVTVADKNKIKKFVVGGDIVVDVNYNLRGVPIRELPE